MTTLLLTRPRVQAARFAADLRARLPGLPIVVSPVLEIVHRRVPVDPHGVAAFVLTSENGAEALAANADVAGKTAFCVGTRTAEAAQAAGMRAISADGDAEDLFALIRARAPSGPLVLAHGVHAAGNLGARLRAAGVDARDLVLYDQTARALTAEARALLAGDAPVLAPLFSPRSAALLALEDIRAPLTLVAISDNAARAWADAGGAAPRRLEVADRPDAAAMLTAIAAVCPPSSA